MRLLMTGLLLLAACAGDACSRSQPASGGGVGESTPGAEPASHEEEENALHLSEDMLRDLRTTTAVVAMKTGLQEVSVLGAVVVDPNHYAEIAPPTGGQIVSLPVATNEVVSAGTRLAQLRSPELGRARAELLRANARRALAAQTLERKRSLAQERIVALREVQEAEATWRAAEADVQAAVAALQALGVSDGVSGNNAGGSAGGNAGGVSRTDENADSSLFYVRAPIGGRVLDRQAVLGAYADPGRPLFTIADLARVWVMAQAFERDAVSVPVGSVAHVTVAALPGREFDGRVTAVAHQVDQGSRTVPVRVELTNREGHLRPGMSATVRLEVGGQATEILTAPAAALQRVGDRWLVFVPRGAAEFEMRPVGRGRDLGSDVEVVSGLKAGETVVVEGAFLLKAEAEKKAGGADEHGH